VAPTSRACQRARAALVAAQASLAADQQALAAKKVAFQSLKRQAAALARRAAALAPQARALAAQAASLKKRQQQAEAEAEKKQTEQLKQELTDELTKAGGDDRGTDPRLVKLQDALATPDGVQLVSPPSISRAGDAATFTVIPTTRPADPKTADLVTQVRTSVIPPATGDGVTAYVGGVTAANVDLAAKISSQLVELILVVLAGCPWTTRSSWSARSPSTTGPASRRGRPSAPAWPPAPRSSRPRPSS
jgi:MMPL family